MMLALNLGEVVAQGDAEILISSDDGAIQIEFNDGLDLTHCLHHAIEFGHAFSFCCRCVHDRR